MKLAPPIQDMSYGLHLDYGPLWLKSLLLLFLFVLPVYCAATLSPAFQGDAHEYNLQLWALASHLTPDIRLDEVEDLINSAQRFGVGFSKDLLSELKEKLLKGEYNGAHFIFRSTSGSYYGLHFWFYSALAVPMKWALHGTAANELKAFQITNSILLALSLGHLFFFCSLTFEFKLTSSLLLFGLGVPYYIRWPGPEVFTAVSCFVMAVAFLERRLLLATFACSLAAIQNPSAALMIPLFFASQLEQWTELPFHMKLKTLAQFLAAGSLALLPFSFFFLKFGTSSLIAKEGYLLSETIDLNRLYSLFFDLNQGMVVGAGWVMGLGVLILLSRLYSSIAQASSLERAPLIQREDLLVLGMFLMAVGVLPQSNWNSVQNVYGRYAFWLSIPLMVWALQQATGLNVRRSAVVAVVVAQLATVCIMGGFSVGGDSYLNHNWLSKAVFNYVPWLYNPEPEIFIERTLGRDTDIRKVNRPVLYRRRRDGVITKVLVRETEIHALQQHICGEGYNLVTQFDVPFQLLRRNKTRYDFVYLSGDMHCLSEDAPHHKKEPSL